MKKTTLYWLPNCSTCQKAAKYLEQNGVKIENFHNIKTDQLLRKEIEKLAELVGGVSELFSKRAIKYREMKLNERELSESEMLKLMMDEYTFIKRPVLVLNDKAIAGFSEKNYEKFLKTNE